MKATRRMMACDFINKNVKNETERNLFKRIFKMVDIDNTYDSYEDCIADFDISNEAEALDLLNRTHNYIMQVYEDRKNREAERLAKYERNECEYRIPVYGMHKTYKLATSWEDATAIVIEMMAKNGYVAAGNNTNENKRIYKFFKDGKIKSVTISRHIIGDYMRPDWEVI